jgi:hypothetical protein
MCTHIGEMYSHLSGQSCDESWKAEEAERGFGMARIGEGASKLRQPRQIPSSTWVLCESDQRVTIAGAGLSLCAASMT